MQICNIKNFEITSTRKGPSPAPDKTPAKPARAASTPSLSQHRNLSHEYHPPQSPLQPLSIPTPSSEHYEACSQPSTQFSSRAGESIPRSESCSSGEVKGRRSSRPIHPLSKLLPITNQNKIEEKKFRKIESLGFQKDNLLRESGEFGDGAETGMAREESLERGFEDEAAVERHLWRDDETLEMMKERGIGLGVLGLG